MKLNQFGKVSLKKYAKKWAKATVANLRVQSKVSF